MVEWWILIRKWSTQVKIWKKNFYHPFLTVHFKWFIKRVNYTCFHVSSKKNVGNYLKKVLRNGWVDKIWSKQIACTALRHWMAVKWKKNPIQQKYMHWNATMVCTVSTTYILNPGAKRKGKCKYAKIMPNSWLNSN